MFMVSVDTIGLQWVCFNVLLIQWITHCYLERNVCLKKRFANIWSHIEQILVIFTLFKLQVAVATVVATKMGERFNHANFILSPIIRVKFSD